MTCEQNLEAIKNNTASTNAQLETLNTLFSDLISHISDLKIIMNSINTTLTGEDILNG